MKKVIKRKTSLLIMGTVISLMAIVHTAQGQENHKPEHGDQAEHKQEGHGRHHAALFSGVAHKHGHGAFAYGFDYSYKVLSKISLGVVIDHAGGELNQTLIAATLGYNPIGGLKFVIGGGTEMEKDHTELAETHTTPALRLGTLYDFHVGDYSIAPTVNLDLVEGAHTLVFGLSFGRSFGRSMH